MHQKYSIGSSIPLHLVFTKEDAILSSFMIPEESKSEVFYIGSTFSR